LRRYWTVLQSRRQTTIGSYHPGVPRRSERLQQLATTHAPKQLESWLHSQTEANGWPLTIDVVWLPTNASWLDQIEIWFSVLQRKLLQPNHFKRLEELAEAILTFISCQNQTAKPIRWTYTVEKLEQKLGMI
jgi:transposase